MTHLSNFNRSQVTNFDYDIELVFKTDNTVDAVYEYICEEITIDELLSKVNPCNKHEKDIYAEE